MKKMSNKKFMVLSIIFSVLFIIIPTSYVSGVTSEVQIISESEYTTRFSFINGIPDLIYSENFTDWSSNTSNPLFYGGSYENTNDTTAISWSPDETNDNLNQMYVSNGSGNEAFGFSQWEYDWMGDNWANYYINTTSNAALTAWTKSDSYYDYENFTIWNSSTPVVTATTTWNTLPDPVIDGVIQASDLIIGDNADVWFVQTIYMTSTFQPYLVWAYEHDGAGWINIYIATRDHSTYPGPSYSFLLNKFMQENDTNMSAINNETEWVSLTRPVSYGLIEDDLIQVYLNNTGDVEGTLVIGSDEFDISCSGSNVLNFTVSENNSISEIEFKVKTEVDKIWLLENISIYTTDPENVAYDLYVGPQADKTYDIENDTYTLRIFENDILVETRENVIVPDINRIIFTRTDRVYVNLGYIDNLLNTLDFNDFRTYVERIEFGIRRTGYIYDNVFTADEDSEFNITVYEKVFDSSVYSATLDVSTSISCTLGVYELKIKNNMKIRAEISINSTYNFVLLKDELIKFSLPEQNYSFSWTDDNGESASYNVSLDENKAFELNTTYNELYISLFTYDGFGINRDLVRFYIDNNRKDLGYNLVKGISSEFAVLDYFNNSLYNETINPSLYTEFNIFVEIYTLNILNQFTSIDLIINITQVGSGINMSQIIPGEFALAYRFLPNLNYSINIYFTNDTLYETKTLNLTENNHIESFGIATVVNPEYPKNIYFGIYTTTGLGINHDLLRFYIDNNRTSFGFNIIKSAVVNVTVKDYFNSTLFSQDVNTTGFYEYDILINLYSIKIKSEMNELSNYTLNLGSLIIDGYIFPHEIIDYQLSSNTYVLNYTNAEDNSFHSLSIELTENRVYVLNTSLYQTYYSIFTSTGLGIDHNLLRFYINNTRTSFGFSTTGSTVLLTVKDYFNTTLFNQSVDVSDLYEYNILVTLYSLKFKSEMLEISNYTLIYGSLETTGFIIPDEIIEYQLSSNNYTFSFTNNEDDSLGSISINLNQDRVYVLNTTYNNIYFGLYNAYGIINPEEVKFYINDVRVDFGFNILKTQYTRLRVLDYFNTSLYGRTLDLTDSTEFSIFIEVYSMIIHNNYTHPILAKIRRGLISVEKMIPIGGYINYNMFPNMSYQIGISYLNGTYIEHDNVILDENNKVVSFGFYVTTVPEMPELVDAITFWIIMIIIGIIVVVGSAFIYRKVKQIDKKEDFKQSVKKNKGLTGPY